MGNFSFKTRHWRSNKGAIDAGVSGKDSWVGMLVDVTIEYGKVDKVSYRLARHNDRFQTLIRDPGDEPELMDRVARFSSIYKTGFSAAGGQVIVSR